MAAALTPPMSSTTSADRAALRRMRPVAEARTSGSNTQGASAVGHASMLIEPTSANTRGESA